MAAPEKVAFKDDIFVKRKPYPNIDHYSCFAQKALGIPVVKFGIFSLARTVVWVRQREEMMIYPVQVTPR